MKKRNDGFFSSIFGSGYDRCRRGFASVYGILYDLDNQVSEIKGSLSRVNGKH